MRAVLLALALGALGARPLLGAATTPLEDGSSVPAWSVTASDGVSATITPDGGALRLDVNFESGAGYAVVRRDLEIALPENFDLAFDVRAQDLPPNNLELKLIGPETSEGVDVWWVNRRAFPFPAQWETLHSKRRHFEFAWGPSGGSASLTKIAAIEIAVASAEGGAGTVWIDNLTLRETEPVRAYTGTPRASGPATTGDGRTPWRDAPEGEAIQWRMESGDIRPWMEIDFGQVRVFGGLLLHWEEGHAPGAYRVLASPDMKDWQTIATIERGDGGTDALYLPDTEARGLRVEIDAPVPPRGTILGSYDVLSVEAAADRNAFVRTLAKGAPQGWFPEYFSGRQCFWTVVGVPNDTNEALFNESGALEIRRGGPTLEPFIDTPEGLITWADVERSQSLLENYLPIPSALWQTPGGLALETTVVADGMPGESRLIVRYRVSNGGNGARQGKLILALRPFQILPEWQRLNMTGGVATVHEITTEGDVMSFDGRRGVGALTEPGLTFLSAFDGADIVRTMHAPGGVEIAGGGAAPASAVGVGVRAPEPGANSITDPNGLASGAFFFPFALEPGDSTDIYVEIPLHGNAPAATSGVDPSAFFEARLAANADAWRELVNKTEVILPGSAAHVWDTVRSNLAYILINQDGDAIQPGSRTYERSWIRDGCVTAGALLSTDHPERVRRYLEWYGAHQFPSGKIPCVVDRRGPDPVDEHDSTGEYLYLLWNYGATTGDVRSLEQDFNRVERAVGYLQSLRAQRLTPEYADPTSEKHVMYGLLPESISHEGYSAKPMHSYWDDFWALKGLRCAAEIARMVGNTDARARYAELADDFQGTLYDSIGLAMHQRGIDYVPGCAELGDFDATSTAIAIFPCGELANMPEPQTRNTFQRYWDHFEARRDGTIEWHGYTPYEARIIGALVLLGHPDRARELMDWLFEDQHPAAWNAWAEVGYREDRFPGWIGDMPHTWVGAGFINSVLTMLAYQRASDDALVLAAGVQPDWLISASGVGVKNLRTRCGALSYHLAEEDGSLTLRVEEGVTPPAGGFVLRVPGTRPIASARVDGQAVGVGAGREIRFDHAPARVEVEFQE